LSHEARIAETLHAASRTLNMNGFVAGCGAAETVRQPFDHKVSAAGVRHLRIENTAGTIHITASNRPFIDVTGTKTANDMTSLGNIIVEIRKEGDTMIVATKYAGKTRGGVEYRISAPAAVALDVQNAAGTADVSGMTGDVRVSTEVGTIDADLGKVDGRRLVDLSTTTGKIKLTVSRDSSARVQAYSGVGNVSSHFRRHLGDT
jgi:hypothetical protein